MNEDLAKTTFTIQFVGNEQRYLDVYEVLSDLGVEITEEDHEMI